MVIGLIIVFGLITPNNAYIKPSNLLNIGLNASQIMLIAVGMTFLIGAGHLDLSVGYNLILASVLGAKVMVGLGGRTTQVAAGEYPNLIPGGPRWRLWSPCSRARSRACSTGCSSPG